MAQILTLPAPAADVIPAYDIRIKTDAQGRCWLNADDVARAIEAPAELLPLPVRRLLGRTIPSQQQLLEQAAQAIASAHCRHCGGQTHD